MLELSILHEISKDYYESEEYRYFLDTNYDTKKLKDRCYELGKEFLNDYALNKTEKSD